MSELMTTREVADYLRIKERKVYDLVREGRIPCSRVTGKWLFPRKLIDLWIAGSTELPADMAEQRSAPEAGSPMPPPVAAGSHDPLLDWALRASQSGLALLPGGSLDGLERLAAGEAMLAGLHVLEEETDTYNEAAIARALPGRPVVAVEWAWRQQGLVVAPGNPLDLHSVADLAERRARVASRQPEAGSQILLLHLLRAAGTDPADIDLSDAPARSEADLALDVQEGRADAGLAVAAVARQHRLDFVPLYRERYDLVMTRRAYFSAPVQTLLAFTRTDALLARADEMGGYDIGGLGRVVYNG